MLHIECEDGEQWDTTLEAFLADNAECMPEGEQAILCCLRPGESYSIGGGAAPLFVVTAVSK